MILDETIHKLAKEKFASLEEKFNEKFNNYFDYSKAVFKGMNTDICIICPEHGEFYQTLRHTLKYACRKCYDTISITTVEEFIQKANIKHSKKYDYSNINFKSLNEHINILCPIHREFKQTPKNHLIHGCQKCAYDKMSYNLTRDEFISKANNKFNFKFKYIDVPDIVNISTKNTKSTKITVICPEHGEFKQKSSTHLKSEFSCPSCAKDDKIAKNMSEIEFIEKSKAKHGNKFDYSSLNFKNIKTKITVICPEHGEQTQKPNYHLCSNFGCLECGKSSFKISKNEFIEKCLKKFKDKFDYKDINYIDYKTDIILNCPEHGQFVKTPEKFLKSRHGCSLCANTFKSGHYSRYIDKKTVLYYIKITHLDKEYYKFGLTLFKKSEANSIKMRYSVDEKLGMKYEIIFFEVFEDGLNAYIIEQKLKYITCAPNAQNNVIPSNIGYTEIRDFCVLDVLKNLISKNS